MLDSNVVIDAALAVNATLRERMAMCDEGDLVASAIAYAEIVHGSMRGMPPDIASLQVFIEEVPVLNFDRAAATAYATLPFKRASYDQLIAAHALSLGLTLVTNNEQDFTDVPGLLVENWTK